MTKLEEKMQLRDESKQRLLSLKREITEKTSKVQQLSSEVDSARASLRNEQTRLVELTQECGRLLHADLSGVIGEKAVREAGMPADGAIV